jgi:hypothetical protein
MPCVFKKGKCGYWLSMREDNVRAQGEDSPQQAKEGGLDQILPS